MGCVQCVGPCNLQGMEGGRLLSTKQLTRSNRSDWRHGKCCPLLSCTVSPLLPAIVNSILKPPRGFAFEKASKCT